jgi:hypothetical protein
MRFVFNVMVQHEGETNEGIKGGELLARVSHQLEEVDSPMSLSSMEVMQLSLL